MDTTCLEEKSMQPEKPLISIITPVFNRANIIQRTINSVIGQTFTNWEHILVDDGSTDNVEEVIKKNCGDESRIIYIKRIREPKSASTCRNIGAENAKGDYLIFLDSDDLLEPLCIERRLKVMNENTDLDFAVFPIKVMHPDGKYRYKDFNNGKDPLINFLSKKSYWAIMCPIWRKCFFTEIGGFNEAFPRYQDIELHIRALAHPFVKYTLCSDHEAAAEVVPNIKKDTIDFILRLHTSLQLLMPQTLNHLQRIGKPELMKHMKGYLKEWLRYLAHTHFNDVVFGKVQDVLGLFVECKVISPTVSMFYKFHLLLARFFTKSIRFIYVKTLP